VSPLSGGGTDKGEEVTYNNRYCIERKGLYSETGINAKGIKSRRQKNIACNKLILPSAFITLSECRRYKKSGPVS